MNPRPSDSPGSTAMGRAAYVFFRALRSVVIVAGVVLAITCLRRGRLEWRTATELLDQNRALVAMVFFGVLIWEYWFQRMRRPRTRSLEISDR